MTSLDIGYMGGMSQREASMYGVKSQRQLIKSNINTQQNKNSITIAFGSSLLSPEALPSPKPATVPVQNEPKNNSKKGLIFSSIVGAGAILAFVLTRGKTKTINDAVSAPDTLLNVLVKSNRKLLYANWKRFGKYINDADFAILNPNRIQDGGKKYTKYIDNVFGNLLKPIDKDLTMYIKKSISPKANMKIGDIVTYKGCNYSVSSQKIPRMFKCGCFNPEVIIPKGSKILYKNTNRDVTTAILPPNPKFKVIDIESGVEDNVELIKNIVLKLVP